MNFPKSDVMPSCTFSHSQAHIMLLVGHWFTLVVQIELEKKCKHQLVNSGRVRISLERKLTLVVNIGPGTIYVKYFFIKYLLRIY